MGNLPSPLYKLTTETQQAQANTLILSLVAQKDFKALQIAFLQTPTLSLPSGSGFSLLLKKVFDQLFKGSCYHCFANT